MLPTKLASAALRGMRSAAVPPEAVVVLMRSLLGVPAATAGRAGGGRPEESGAVSGAALRGCARVPGGPGESGGVIGAALRGCARLPGCPVAPLARPSRVGHRSQRIMYQLVTYQ